MRFWLKQGLYRLGQRLVLLNYVPYEHVEQELAKQVRELRSRLVVEHDMRKQIQDLRAELKRAKLAAIVERLKSA